MHPVAYIEPTLGRHARCVQLADAGLFSFARPVSSNFMVMLVERVEGGTLPPSGL